MKAGRASRTAVLVCQGRAAADGRFAVGRFADPVALALLTEAEQVTVRQVRDAAPPSAWIDRMAYLTVRASAEVIVPRTVAIDDAIRAQPNPQLVILGAGLDARAWRLPELAGVAVFEVDHPASQVDKQARMGGRQAIAASLRFVPVDFTRGSLTGRLAAAGHRPELPTTWVWEGVIPYLRRAEVVATMADLTALSAEHSRLVVNYQSPSLRSRVGWVVARTLAGRRSPLAGEPWRSLWRPEEIEVLARRYGFVVIADDDLLTLASALGSPTGVAGSLRTGRVAVADRAAG